MATEPQGRRSTRVACAAGRASACPNACHQPGAVNPSYGRGPAIFPIPAQVPDCAATMKGLLTKVNVTGDAT